ncbi:hypothetical protein ACSBLW_03100 [Thioclava sp. FR2]|uniref:hypothetical protein n=1 Tax=Thioclava sp. FR2 TaxID=3445780 RepID=UPI003EBD0ACA
MMDAEPASAAFSDKARNDRPAEPLDDPFGFLTPDGNPPEEGRRVISALFSDWGKNHVSAVSRDGYIPDVASDEFLGKTNSNVVARFFYRLVNRFIA